MRKAAARTAQENQRSSHGINRKKAKQATAYNNAHCKQMIDAAPVPCAAAASRVATERHSSSGLAWYALSLRGDNTP